MANQGLRWWTGDGWHRIGGPAIESDRGTKQWWVNNKRHRIDGPAVENLYGRDQWWINGRFIRGDVEGWIEQFNIDLSTKDGQMRLKLTWG